MEDRHLLEAVFGSFNPLRLHMKLAITADEFDPDNISLETLATWVHERSHFHQTIFTGFGQICWDSQRQMTGYLVNEWNKMPLFPNGKRGIPLAHAAGHSIPARVMAILARDTSIELIMLFRARHSLPNPNGRLSDLKLKLLSKPWPINPVIRVGENEHPLEGNDVLEGHALFCEATLLESQGRERDEIWDHASLPKRYWIARDWFLEQIGEERYSDFPFVCDLALQTSRIPDLPETQFEWEAASPSWRFVKLTEALGRDAKITVGGPEKWAENYNGFAQTLLSSCKFKPLNQVLEERIEALNRRPEKMNLEKLLERAIEIRMKMPWCAANPIADTALWRQLLGELPAPLIQIEGGISNNVGSNQLLNNEIVMELQFQALASQILGDFSAESKSHAAIECAFKKYDISNGCEFQRTHQCPGFYSPAKGTPHPPDDSTGNLSGCTFEALLISSGNPSSEIELNADATLPTFNELVQGLKIQGE